MRTNVGSAAAGGSPTAVSEPTSVAATNPGLSVQGRAIDNVIRQRAPGSPMIGLGARIVQLVTAYNVHPAVIVGFAGAETRFGPAGMGRVSEGRNVFGIGQRRYNSYADSVEDIVKLISSKYYDEGNHTIAEIVPVYSPASDGNDVPGHIRNITNIAKLVSSAFTDSTDVRIMGGDTGRTTLDGIIGDAAGAVSDAVTSPITAVVEFLKFLADPKLWLRIGTMLLGVIGMVLGALFMFRGGGNSAKPVGLLIVLFGFGWLWAGLANLNPVQLVKDVVTG